MEWYYAKDGQQMGPVSEGDLTGMAASGEVSAGTLVWRSGFDQWRSYGSVFGAAVSASLAPGTLQCVECGQVYPSSDMIQYAGHAVCARCKPVFFQRLREGGLAPRMMAYAGFWLRAVAKIIDQIILFVANMLVQTVFMFGWMMPMMKDIKPGSPPPAGFWAMYALLMIFQFSIPLAFSTFFVGKFDATPGKMALGLKVVMSDGGKVTYLRALGRALAEILSGMILLMGYIMAGWDDERRTLHDRICDTRVITK